MKTFLATFLALTPAVPILIIHFIAAKYVKQDRERAQKTFGHPGELTLGPWRWAIITFFAGGLGLGLYWFATYQNAFVELLKSKQNNGKSEPDR